MVEELLLSGADIIKIGIGPGSVCTTRKQTGVGYPQLSAILECADAAHGLGGHVISDGGCTCPGDFSKVGDKQCLSAVVVALQCTIRPNSRHPDRKSVV
jgi:IMP dehydrogenase/GMP reductase